MGKKHLQLILLLMHINAGKKSSIAFFSLEMFQNPNYIKILYLKIQKIYLFFIVLLLLLCLDYFLVFDYIQLMRGTFNNF